MQYSIWDPAVQLVHYQISVFHLPAMHCSVAASAISVYFKSRCRQKCAIKKCKHLLILHIIIITIIQAKLHDVFNQHLIITITIIIITRPRPAFGRLGLGGSSGGYSSHG